MSLINEFKIGLWNAWIPLFFNILIMALLYLISKEGAKRASPVKLFFDLHDGKDLSGFGKGHQVHYFFRRKQNNLEVRRTSADKVNNAYWIGNNMRILVS